jgi:copper(I)-binding protein
VNRRILINSGLPPGPAPAAVRGARGIAPASVALAAVAFCLSACGSTGSLPAAAGSSGAAASPSPSLAHVKTGDVEVTGAYIPQPASSDVAVAYFTLRDTGPTGDVLLSASTEPASQAMVMREAATGSNAGAMVDVTGGLAIPAHGAVTLAPGGYHLMLTHPAVRLVAGDHVMLTLVMRDAGSVRIDVPVTSLGSDAQNAPMPSTPGM